jgi:glycosyltransferase involved in cell wall biosynthesis
MNPRTSVIIPCYNAAATVKRAIGSVLAQSDADLEVIAIDDGSTDTTLMLLHSFTDQRLRVVAHDVNRGISAARNTGLSAATGEFIAFLDSDDTWEVEFLARLHDARGEADGAICGRTILLPDGNQRTAHSDLRGSLTGEETAIAMMTGRVTPFPWDKVLRRSAFEGLAYPIDVHRFEDQVVGVIAVSRTARIISIPDPLIRYHVSPSSLTWGRIPELAEAEKALAFLERGLHGWLSTRTRRDAFNTCTTMFLMLTAQSAMRVEGTTAKEAIMACRRRISPRLIASTLRGRPVLAGGAILLKASPRIYRGLLATYLKRQYAMD